VKILKTMIFLVTCCGSTHLMRQVLVKIELPPISWALLLVAVKQLLRPWKDNLVNSKKDPDFPAFA